LVSAAGCPQLLLPHSPAAGVAAISLAPITTRADGEKHVAREVNASAHAKALNRPICCHGLPSTQHNTTGDDRTDDCAFGAMMSFAIGPKFRKLRFQMIANRW
jgi:hypothetical protein